MISRNLNDARRTPVIAAIPKVLMPAIVILPGLIILALQSQFTGFDLPRTPSGDVDYNMTLPVLLKNYTPAGCWALALRP